MSENTFFGSAGKFRVILPVILRLTFCLAMWTLGVMTMTIAEPETAAKTFTKQTEDNNPQLTRRAALTTPPGVFS